MVERGRWMKLKVQYIDRKCTLCNLILNVPDINEYEENDKLL